MNQVILAVMVPMETAQAAKVQGVIDMMVIIKMTEIIAIHMEILVHFGVFGPFGFGGGYAESFGDDENGRYFQAAVNYIRNGSYREALNVLENISERDGKMVLLQCTG